MQKKILIIDDDYLILYGLSKALRSDTTDVTTVPSATGAVEELAHAPYDLCLMDLHLPDANGFELMKTIRRTWPHTKIIVMTASFLNDEDLSAKITEAATNGACHFLPKPFDIGELKEIISGVLNADPSRLPWEMAAGQMTRQTRKHSRHGYAQEMEIALVDAQGRNPPPPSTTATSIDISEGGVGLRTCFPLRGSQMISMRSGLSEKMGVVVWNRMGADNTCRAGIRFV
ncbi:MAG: response regulator [Desulfurivibrionaceae bacterium]|nr:response regulator [Desulfurivibrionaceae bacterium]